MTSLSARAVSGTIADYITLLRSLRNLSNESKGPLNTANQSDRLLDTITRIYAAYDMYKFCTYMLSNAEVLTVPLYVWLIQNTLLGKLDWLFLFISFFLFSAEIFSAKLKKREQNSEKQGLRQQLKKCNVSSSFKIQKTTSAWWSQLEHQFRKLIMLIIFGNMLGILFSIRNGIRKVPFPAGQKYFISRRMCIKKEIGTFCSKYFLIACLCNLTNVLKGIVQPKTFSALNLLFLVIWIRGSSTTSKRLQISLLSGI